MILSDMLAPWHDLVQIIMQLTTYVSIITAMVLLSIMIINKIKHKKTRKSIIIVFGILSVIAFFTVFTDVIESTLIEIFKKIYGY